MLINHLKTGQNVRVKYFLEEKNTFGKFFDATIRYIRMVSEGQFKGHYLVGLERLKLFKLP